MEMVGVEPTSKMKPTESLRVYMFINLGQEKENIKNQNLTKVIFKELRTLKAGLRAYCLQICVELAKLTQLKSKLP